MDKAYIDLLPGFRVIEYTPGYTILDVPSGFRLKIKRMGPYMFDAIDRPDLKDPGPFMITVTLLEKIKPPGVEQTIIYEPPRDDDDNVYEPDREKFEKAWMYYKQWQLHQHKRRELQAERGKIRYDFALRNCVEILPLSGSMEISDDSWVEPIIDMIEEFQSVGDRYVIFLKTQVMSTPKTTDVVSFLFTVEEVTLEGLKQAFDSFWRGMEWREAVATYGRPPEVGDGVQHESVGDAVRELERQDG